jgi:hypothetical protein
MSGPGFQHAIDCATAAPVLTANVAERVAEQRPDARTLATLRRLQRHEAAA